MLVDESMACISTLGARVGELAVISMKTSIRTVPESAPVVGISDLGDRLHLGRDPVLALAFSGTLAELLAAFTTAFAFALVGAFAPIFASFLELVVVDLVQLELLIRQP